MLGRTRGFPGLRFSLTVLLISAATMIPAASTALADHSRGATYIGSHPHGVVEFDVSPDGWAVTRFRVTNVTGSTCFFFSASVTGSFPIGRAEPHGFSQTTGKVTFTGTFHPGQWADGTFRLDFPGCQSPTLPWKATTTTPWDTVAPRDPALIASHSPAKLSRDNTIEVTWSGADDDWSGVDGFSFVFDQSATTIPDTVMDVQETVTATSSTRLGNGSWYFHLRTRDNAGNWTSAVHLGPFRIDTRCIVPQLKGKSLRAARAALAKGLCRVGRVTGQYSSGVAAGRVISQSRRAGARLKRGTGVHLVVSRGRRP